MSNLIRRDERDFMSLHEAMDRLIGDSFVPFGRADDFTPSVNVAETADNIVVQAALPGFKPENLDITLTGDVLTIKGEVKQEEELKGDWTRIEWRYGAFQRTFTLPCPVNPDAIQTQFENGVLTLTLPKADAVKPKRLQIKTKK